MAYDKNTHDNSLGMFFLIKHRNKLPRKIRVFKNTTLACERLKPRVHAEDLCYTVDEGSITYHRVPTPPPSLRVVKAGKNHLNEETTLLLSTGRGEQHSQTISNLGPAPL